MSAIEDLPGDKTLIMIAHRLTTLRNCDRILVLDRGKISGLGSWNELLASNDIFRNLEEGGAKSPLEQNAPTREMDDTK
jgi:ABC-type multidrug transport system fused ATPase/permease subunit